MYDPRITSLDMYKQTDNKQDQLQSLLWILRKLHDCVQIQWQDMKTHVVNHPPGTIKILKGSEVIILNWDSDWCWKDFVLTFTPLWAYSIDDKRIVLFYFFPEIFSLFFLRKKALTFHANCLHRRWQFAWNVKAYFLEKKNSKCCLLKFYSKC